MAADMFLYWGSGSAPCWRVMLALEEKGLSGYGNKLISFDKDENKSEEILKWNPRGQVPTFIHNNHAVNESFAACEYLERVFAKQGTQLLPDDPAQLALVLQRKHEMRNLDLKGDKCVAFLYKEPEAQDEANLKKELEIFFKELEIWEGYLSARIGDTDAASGFLASKTLSMADIVFFPCLALYVRLGLELDPKYPGLSRYYKKMLTLPSVQKTWPPHWKASEAPRKIFVAA
jgi:glutathione S-transferase